MHSRIGPDLGRRPHRRAPRWLRCLPVLVIFAVLGAAVPLLRAALPALPERLTERFAPALAAEVQALEEENAALRSELAATAGLREQNTALRALLGSPAPRPAALYTARALARTDAGLLLWCAEGAPQSGAAVLDRRGHFSGRAAAVQGQLVQVPLPDGEACFVGEDPALVRCTPDGWQVTGLPVPAAAGAGTLVTTPEGYWLGRLAAAPEPEADTGGLTAAAPLQDTAAADSRYFVARR